MNITTLRKNYDKLGNRERFAAIVAADLRNDNQERTALMQSAPRKQWSIPTVRGLSEAFDFLAMWHVMYQLGCAASLYLLLTMDEEPVNSLLEGENINFQDALLLVQRRILESREAWRAICNEYGVDPEGMLSGLPYLEMIEMVELVVRTANQLKPFELTDLQENINGYRETIEHKRKEWE
jgi:hypothetical protein